MLKQLDEDLFHIAGSFGSNIYVATSNGLTLIDAGFPVDLPWIHMGLRKLGTGPGDLDLIVATHYHGDHVGTVAGLKRRYDVRVAVHEEDIPYANGNLPYERFEVETSRLIFYTLLWPFFRYRCFDVDRSLKEGENLDLLGGLEVLHTPGHTVGSICLYNREKKLLFSGDLIRNENGVMEGPPPQFTPDPDTAARSLEKIADLEFDTLLPGHGDPILSGAGERFTALYETKELWPLSEQ